MFNFLGSGAPLARRGMRPPHPSRPGRPGSDFGPNPYVVNIHAATENNHHFRNTLWTGKHLQLTVMYIAVGDDVGLEMHPHVDQFFCIVEGQGLVMMGDNRERLLIRQPVYEDFALFVPAGTWHNIINTGHKPLQLYTIYAPPNHPHGTVHQTKAMAEAAEAAEKA